MDGKIDRQTELLLQLIRGGLVTLPAAAPAAAPPLHRT